MYLARLAPYGARVTSSSGHRPERGCSRSSRAHSRAASPSVAAARSYAADQTLINYCLRGLGEKGPNLYLWAHDNLQQAMRVADTTAFMYVDTSGGGRTGYLVEYGSTKAMFDSPKEDYTKQYIRGEFS